MKNLKLALFFIFLGGQLAIGQDVELFQIFAGRYDYLALGNTLNTGPNGGITPCELLTESSATLDLEADQDVIAAFLYWAGPGSGDFDVSLNGTPVTASRTFSSVNNSSTNLIYFAAFADITPMIVSSGATQYTFGDLDLDTVLPTYCPSGTNFAGWSIIVVYEDMDFPLNQVNLFDGLESVSVGNSELIIELENLNVVNKEAAKIGFLAWEGDETVALNETLVVNGNVLNNPPLNPMDNQFNGSNTFTGSDQLYNMDIDVYDIENDIEVGDTSAEIRLTSSQDFVMINSVVTVINSQLPDATITIDDVQTECNSRDVVVNFTVTNFGNDTLEAGTPIAFAGTGVLIPGATTTTDIDLEMGESTVGSMVTITIPDDFPDVFTLIAIIDEADVVTELDNNNNESPEEVLVVLEELIVDSLEDLFLCDDVSNDGVEMFNLLEPAEAAITDDMGVIQQGVSILFYLNMNDAENQVNPITNPTNYENIMPLQTIYVRFALIDSETCIFIFPLEIGVLFQPEVPIIDPIKICDDPSNDGIEFFDLSTLEPDVLELVILAGQDPVDFTISYHNTQADADTGANPITPITAAPLTGGSSIFIRLANNITDDPVCFDTEEIMVIVDPAAIANPVPALISCTGDFDLTSIGAIILGTQDPLDFTVTYHNTQADADTGANPIPDITLLSLIDGSILYARIERNDNSSCFDTTEITFTIDTTLVITPIPTQTLCDDPSNDGVEFFDLSTLNITVPGISNLADFNITFHNTQVDADTNMGGITPITLVLIADGDSIFARIENIVSPSCFGTIEIMFVVAATPIANTVSGQTVCDDSSNDGIADFDLSALEALILGTQVASDFSITFHTTQVDADANIAAINPTNSVALVDGSSVFVRIENLNNPSCFDTTEITFFVEVAPVLNTVPAQIVCDDPSNDGLEDFDLSVLETIILGTQNPLDVTITFHNTQADADLDTGAITPIGPMSMTDGDSVFIRVESNISSCFETEEVIFTIDALPVANVVPSQVGCDDPSNDGITDFDLSTLESTILGTQIASDFSITFHNTQVGADTNTLGINPTTSVTLADGDSVFVRIENSNNSSCFDTTEITFSVNESPVANAVPAQVICDDLSNDGMVDFDLSALETTILGAQVSSDFSVTFHNTQSDANAGIGVITSTTGVLIADNESIFVRVESNANGCFDTTEITFSVGAQPIANTAPDQFVCDDLSNDGIATFNLDIQDVVILGNQSGILLTYHESLEDAETGANPVINTSDYSSIASTQTIYTRVVNQSISSCFDTGSFDLSVLPVADIMIFESQANCDEGLETSTFDLTSNPDVLDISIDLIENYYTSLSDAETQVNEISDPSAFQNTLNPQTVFVRIEGGDASTCYEIGQISLMVERCEPFIPEGFSPNGDGINDIFEISGIKGVFEDYQLSIYSRLGNLIYEGGNDVDFWNGEPNNGIGGGDILPVGVYFWVLELNDATMQDQTGWVYLNR